MLINCASGSAMDAGAAPVVLRVGDRSFTAAEVQALLAQQPEVMRARYSTDEGRLEFLEGLARTELLLVEARRRGLENDPAVRGLVERLLVQKLAEQATPAEPTEAELRTAYERAQSEFVKPDRLHVRAVFLASPRGAANRDQVKKEGAALHAGLLKTKPTERESRFDAVARTRSDLLSSRDSGGDLGPRTPADLAALVGEGVEPGLLSLQQTGSMTELLETERGFVVLYLRGRQPGLTQSFESVKPRLSQRLLAEGRARSLEDLVVRLKKARPVEVDQSVLKTLALPSSGPLLVDRALDGG
jgi:parvulin-like peptidyl-prolyl isomerase